MDGAVSTIWLDRPAQRNALGLAGWTEIRAAVAAIEARSECVVAVLRGGGNFGAGADISEFPAMIADAGLAERYAAAMEAAMASIEGAAKPVIAAIEGLCIGACVALALACDIRLASAAARFAVTPAKLGLAYPYGDIRRLIDAVGPGRAKLLLMTGDRIDAAEALHMQLVDRVAEPDGFEAALATLVATIGGNSQWTVRRSKTAVAHILAERRDPAAAHGFGFADGIGGEDFQEGLAAFFGKRPPRLRLSLSRAG